MNRDEDGVSVKTGLPPKLMQALKGRFSIQRPFCSPIRRPSPRAQRNLNPRVSDPMFSASALQDSIFQSEMISSGEMPMGPNKKDVPGRLTTPTSPYFPGNPESSTIPLGINTNKLAEKIRTTPRKYFSIPQGSEDSFRHASFGSNSDRAREIKEKLRLSSQASSVLNLLEGQKQIRQERILSRMSLRHLTFWSKDQEKGTSRASQIACHGSQQESISSIFQQEDLLEGILPQPKQEDWSCEGRKKSSLNSPSLNPQDKRIRIAPTIKQRLGLILPVKVEKSEIHRSVMKNTPVNVKLAFKKQPGSLIAALKSSIRQI